MQKTLTKAEKEKRWGKGPWVDEPDHMAFRYNGIPCIAHRHMSLGHWCGYVGVEPGHPWRSPNLESFDGYPSVDVHGGLTYGALCDEEMGICHQPLPGESADVMWFGFDCCHAGDASPGMPDTLVGEQYRHISYVRAEILRLADQAVAARKEMTP